MSRQITCCACNCTLHYDNWNPDNDLCNDCLKGTDTMNVEEELIIELRKINTKTLELITSLMQPSVTGDLASDCLALMQDELVRRKDATAGDKVGEAVDKGIKAANHAMDRLKNWRKAR